MYQELSTKDLTILLRSAQGDIKEKVDEIVKELTARGKLKLLKQLDQYTNEEKCAKFDALYRFAKEHYDSNKYSGYTNDDSKHYIYEDVMNMLGEYVWENYNFFAV